MMTGIPLVNMACFILTKSTKSYRQYGMARTDHITTSRKTKITNPIQDVSFIKRISFQYGMARIDQSLIQQTKITY